HSNEEVARKQRRPDHLDLAGMAAALEITRKIRTKALASQVFDRLRFRMRLGLDDIPARCHALASRRGRTSSIRGTSTRSGPTSAAAASKTSCAAPRSVTTTASNG